MKITIILGTRPEIIKLSPIIKKLSKKNSTIIFTGQHSDYNMSLNFMEELNIRKPDFYLSTPKFPTSRNRSVKQIGKMIMDLSEIINFENSDTIMVQGDTNSVLAGSISGIKCNIPISHVEAGLRSNDWRMQEEHNRIITDHISEFLFAPTKHAKTNLTSENVHGKIFVTGNTSIDAVEQNIIQATKKGTMIFENDYILLTLHRAENVDDPKILKNILSALIKSKTKVIFPIHPRTKIRLQQIGLLEKMKNSKIITIQPLGYFDMLNAMKNCLFIITDSGGIQEEATSPQIRKKTIVVRKTTDRPETIETGFSNLVGTKSSHIIKSIKQNLDDSKVPRNLNPFGNGNASVKILNLLKQQL